VPGLIAVIVGEVLLPFNFLVTVLTACLIPLKTLGPFSTASLPRLK
jgi:hypothetical protein